MVKAIVGANWGDEGKGKITDMLAEESDIIVRFQGGSNAGHTIINDYGKFALHIHNNPVKSVDNGEDQTVFGFYRDLIIAKINDEPHCYHKEVIQHLFSAIFCEMMGQLHKEMEAAGNTEGSKEGIKQVNYILRKFMELLSKDKGMHRSVSYFANELCYTPKHFSKVIKQACGRTPLDLINETTVEHIKYRLKRSEKSIKEIAEEFNFPNQSFFGKYVEAHLGTSPANYRNRKEE